MTHASRPGARGVRHRWWRSLAARSTFAIGGLLAALAALLISAAAIDARRDAISSIERDLAAEVDRITTEIAAGEQTPARFNSIVASSSLDYVYLTTQSGAVIAGSSPSLPPPGMSNDGLAATVDSNVATVVVANGMANVAKIVMSADGREAVLRAGSGLDRASGAVRDVVVGGMLATLAFLALALPVVALTIDRAAAPLRALTRAVTRPGDAQDEIRLAGDRQDEIGALARAHLSIARNLAENADALHRLTFDDPLTKLPNRASLTSRLTRALQVGQRVALLKIEVDGMLRVAAGLGQQHGDEAVLRVADRIRDAAADWCAPSNANRPRGVDDAVFVARVSDSGFAMLAFGADAEAGEDLARCALAAFEAPLNVASHVVSVTLSIGIAAAPDDGDEAETLMRSAAAAMSAARATGPQSIRNAGADLNQRAYGRLRLEQDLRRAIDQGELEVHYQPQIALKAGVVSGAEALVRWRHPTRGYISPLEFVALAEESGLVEGLGRFVLAEACRTSARWTQLGMALRIAVNVSTIQFRNPRFAENTLNIIRESGAEPFRIELEITESAAMGDPAHALRELTPLKDAGVTIAIDDFGTGYSNLATLTQLPFDVLKIDRGFVRDALEQTGARVVVGTVIGMAEHLGFETVAEGVETADQLEFVTGHGCTYAQGYYFGKPMPAPAFEAWYANRLVAELRAIGERVAHEAGIAPDAAWLREPRQGEALNDPTSPSLSRHIEASRTRPPSQFAERGR